MRAEVLHADSREALAGMADASIDACVTDPPYALKFMGKDWDTADVAFAPTFWRDVLRVLKPGAHLLAFGGTRTYHRLVCAIEDAGFEIRDTVSWLYGSGFPKSHNQDGDWKGWGTALKPACELICLGRKPLVGTVEKTLLTHGCGALNVDGCRIGVGEGGTRDGEASAARRYINNGNTNFAATPGPRGGDARGRWPANVVHDDSAEVLAAFPDAPGQQGDLVGHSTARKSPNGIFGEFKPARDRLSRGDSGSAARFFYCAKASKADRNEGCADLPDVPAGMRSETSGQHIARRDGGAPTVTKNNHPTVKPTNLMRWLVRLVTSPGGMVLDPFAGSGSTGKACVLEGFNFIGIEREAAYVDIARRRIAAVSGVFG